MNKYLLSLILGCLLSTSLWAIAPKPPLNFMGEDLSGKQLTHLSLQGANFDYANLSLADLSYSDVSNASFHLTLIEFTKFEQVKGLTAKQLQQACLPMLPQGSELKIKGFDPKQYKLPAACKIWDHVPRG